MRRHRTERERAALNFLKNISFDGNRSTDFRQFNYCQEKRCDCLICQHSLVSNDRFYNDSQKPSSKYEIGLSDKTSSSTSVETIRIDTSTTNYEFNLERRSDSEEKEKPSQRNVYFTPSSVLTSQGVNKRIIFVDGRHRTPISVTSVLPCQEIRATNRKSSGDELTSAKSPQQGRKKEVTDREDEDSIRDQSSNRKPKLTLAITTPLRAKTSGAAASTTSAAVKKTAAPKRSKAIEPKRRAVPLIKSLLRSRGRGEASSEVSFRTLLGTTSTSSAATTDKSKTGSENGATVGVEDGRKDSGRPERPVADESENNDQQPEDQIDIGIEINTDLKENQAPYDPWTLDDPELTTGKYKTLMTLPSYVTSVLHYASRADLKRELNDQFKRRFPDIELTLSKLRSLKREMNQIGVRCDLETATVSAAFVYFEKLVLKRFINKKNRKIVAGNCIIVAAKLDDVKGAEMEILISDIEESLRIAKRDVLKMEIFVLVALEFSLKLQRHEVFPHYQRLKTDCY